MSSPQGKYSSILAGVLVDVSGSMKANFQHDLKSTNQNDISRAESIFKTIISIAEREVKADQKQEMFVLAFGLTSMNTCDLLYLLEKTDPVRPDGHIHGRRLLFDLLKRNGAPHTEKYIEKYLTDTEAAFLYDNYSENSSDLKEIIDDLPSACKNGGVVGGATRGFQNLVSILFPINNPLEGTEEENTRKHAEKAIQNARTKISKFDFKNKLLNELRENKVPKAKTFKCALELLRKVTGASNGRPVSTEQIRDLVFSIETYIYGGTPMCEAIGLALDVFRKNSHDDKVLFLLTDGEATDGSPVKFVQLLRDNGINVLVCLITSQHIQYPRQLYYTAERNWTQQQKDMFELSSTVDNSHSAMSILLEHGWQLPPDGQSRLFVQANHPQVIDEFASLVRNLTQNVDALLNIFGRVSLDKYINMKMTNFDAPNQVGGTCYANAVAAVLHLAMSRIVGRKDGVPEFEGLRKEIIQAFGKNGAYTASVLTKWTQKYRLHFQEVNELAAKQAINARRPVVAIFALYEQEWSEFSKFYQNNPQGILEKKDLGSHRTLTKNSGHAVVLMKCDPKGLIFMNSWGNAWADNGFFKVRDQSVLSMTFYDVYWTLDDLYQCEKDAYERKKLKEGDDFVRDMPQSVKQLPFKCPQCGQSSAAKDFAGHLLEATCPKCKQTFRPTPLGFDLNW